ncbi:MAG: cytochrome b/b6 domain-containing protein [Proteobacteria bacterium]|nr:cytochrome b/b6 domain-containing protein [Pseudomonadota bacterium]
MIRKTYSGTQRVLHWGTFGLFLIQLWTYPAIGRTHHAAHLGEKVEGTDLMLHSIHAFSGGLILVFALVRLWLRYREPVEPPVFRWDAVATLSKLVHFALYAMLILLPITGVLKMYVLPAAGPVHVLLTRLLYGLLVLHVAGVALHALFWRDNLLARMGVKLPFQRQI